MKRTFLAGAAAGFALLMAVHATSHASDRSRGANPHGLDYSRIEMERPEFDEPFQRDGRLVAPAQIVRLVPGTPVDGVRALIGEPIATRQGARGPEWDYNLKLDLADEDFIVCQYKVVLDARSETVVETSWRRYQCRDAIAAFTASGG